MTGWDIEPAGVKGVVERTRTQAEGFQKFGTQYGTSMQSAAGACGSQLVALALKDFADHNKDALKSMVDRTVASLTGTVDATKAYLNGDEEMAARAQHGASVAASVNPRPR